MATAETIVQEIAPKLTRNQKATIRCNERRQHIRSLREKIKSIRAEYRMLKKTNEETYAECWDAVLNDLDQRQYRLLVASRNEGGLTQCYNEPEAPTRHHGKAPTTYALYQYLCRHAEHEALNGKSLGTLLRDNREKDEQNFLRDAWSQIQAAVDQAVANVPDSMPKLREELRRIGNKALEKMQPRQAEVPVLGSSMLNDYGLEKRLEYARSIRTYDTDRPPLTDDEDAAIEFDYGPDSLTIKQNGRRIASSAQDAAGRDALRFQYQK